MKIKSLLLFFCLSIFASVSLQATPDVVNLEDHKEGIVSLEKADANKALTKADMKAAKKLEKKQLRMDRKMAKMEKFLSSKKGQKMLGGLDDPVDKFFWYWVIAWGAGIVLSILVPAIFLSGGLGGATALLLLSTLVWLAGTVALVIWLVKKFA